MRDAVTEIAIENPITREAFIRWWRTMEAQGYQYGFEALCNVWVGFNDGRADLARNVLEVVEAQKHPYEPAGSGEYNDAVHNTLTAVCQLFTEKGIDVTSRR